MLSHTLSSFFSHTPQTHTYVSTHTPFSTHEHIHTYLSAQTHTLKYTHIHAHTHIWTSAHSHTHPHPHARVCPLARSNDFCKDNKNKKECLNLNFLNSFFWVSLSAGNKSELATIESFSNLQTWLKLMDSHSTTKNWMSCQDNWAQEICQGCRKQAPSWLGGSAVA